MDETTTPTPEPVACLNDRWLTASRVGLSLFDAGFVYGATIVETQRTFRHQLRFPTLHLDRFERNVKLCGFGEMPPRERFLEVLTELVERNCELLNEPEELALYLFATPGRTDSTALNRRPTWGAYTQKFPFERYRRYFETGVDLRVPDVSPVPAGSIDPRIKHRSRFHWWLAEQQVKKDASPGSAPLALLIDDQGIVYDTPIANFGYACGREVFFPRHDSVLDGIALKITKEFLIGDGVKYTDYDIHLSTMIDEADEAFITGSSIGVCPVRSIEDHEMLLNPGPVTRRLRERWDQLLGFDISASFLAAR